MRSKLPKEIDPLRLAQNGLKLDGQLLLNTMPRLAASLNSDEGVVEAQLAFDVDEIGTPYMKGELTTEVSMICERCMSPMTVTLSVNCLLAMVISERKIDALAEHYDPWLLENSDPVSLSKVIEDELILALPLVPRHTKACLPKEVWSAGSDDSEVEEGNKPESPFAILSSLKKKQ